MKSLLILSSLIVIFTVGGIGIFTTLPNTVDLQKSDPIKDYYEKNEKYNILFWKSYTYDQDNQKLITIYRNENYDIKYWKEFKYDQFGNLIESIYFDNEGNLKRIQKSIFDPYGNRIKTTATDHQGNLTKLQESEFTSNFALRVNSHLIDELIPSIVNIFYDENGNQIKLQYITKNGTNLINYSYSYDFFGNMIEFKIFPYDVKESSTLEQFEYDENGNLITHKTIPNWKFDYVTNYEYDKKGNKIVETQRILKDNNEHIKIITYTSYDDKGNKIVEKTVNTLDKLTFFNTMTYDDAGNIIESREFASYGNIISWKKFNYDRHNNLVESKEFDKNANIVSWKKFNYDLQDNLIELKEFNIEKNVFDVGKKLNASNDFELSPENNNDFQKFNNNTLVDSNEIVITPSFDTYSRSNFLLNTCVLDCFTPNPVKVDVGTKVTFSNTANNAYSFTSGNAYDGPDGLWDSSLLVPGTKYSIILNEKGTYEYYSQISPWMTGKIVVGDIAGHQPPTANAGSDQTIDEGTTVFLSGLGTDPEEQLLTYRWTQILGPSVLLSGTHVPGQSSTMQHTTFTAPDINENIDLIFRLVVTDTVPPSAPKSLPELGIDIVTITIQNVSNNQYDALS